MNETKEKGGIQYTIENRQILKEKLQVFISYLGGEMKIVTMFYL